MVLNRGPGMLKVCEISQICKGQLQADRHTCLELNSSLDENKIGNHWHGRVMFGTRLDSIMEV